MCLTQRYLEAKGFAPEGRFQKAANLVIRC
jgi:hypothetical protein